MRLSVGIACLEAVLLLSRPLLWYNREWHLQLYDELDLFIDKISSSVDFWIKLDGRFSAQGNRLKMSSSSLSEYLGSEELKGR